MKIKKGDNVKIIKGKDNGKNGKVLRVFPQDNKILVEGLNMFKKHSRPKKQGEKGEVIQITRPLAVSNAMIICNACSKTTRVGYKITNGAKERFCKKCNLTI